MHEFCPIKVQITHMKTFIFAAFIILISLASCTVTDPGEYYPQQRSYNNWRQQQQYDPYYNQGYDRYITQRIYDYNTGRYYDVPVYNSPVYRDRYYSRDNYRNNVRREYYREAQPRYVQPRVERQVEQPREKRLPDGTRVSPDGTITLPNGEVRNRQ